MKNLLISFFFVTAVMSGPARHWSFDDQQTKGPRPPEYPSFKTENRALRIATRQIVTHPGNHPAVQFKQGDTITLEAWIELDAIAPDQNMYIVGKGRTHNETYPKNNQNYALRLRGQNGGGSISFLFHSAGEDGDWHRWTSHESIAPNSGWHHIAISYKFGTPNSIKGYINGVSIKGNWDMGGKTIKPPMVDDDEIWIGSSMGRSPNSTFAGSIDEVYIHREALHPDTIAKRYARQAPPTPELPDAPTDKVLVEIFEKGFQSKSWKHHLTEATETYTETAFGFFRHPYKYISTGIREDRPSPFIIRAISKIALPAGEYELLIRSRTGSRLYRGEELLTSLPFRGGFQDGHNPIRTDYLDLGPGVRWAFPGCREKVITLVSDGSLQSYRLEFFVGGLSGKSQMRTDIGETSISVRKQGHPHFTLLGPELKYPYTDTGWLAFQDERTPLYEELDAANRAKALSSEGNYWKSRHSHAREWTKSQPGFTNRNIDGFIHAKIHAAKSPQNTLNNEEAYFVNHVKPLLKDHCWRCHGEKEKGGLRLDSLAAAIQGGDSKKPALVPGHAQNSHLLELVLSNDDDKRMPPKGAGLTEKDAEHLSIWIQRGAAWPTHQSGEQIALTPMTRDSQFLRRVYLDTVGVPPSEEEIDRFMSDPAQVRRTFVINRLLEDPRWADHWVGYWQDVLAENPNIVKPSLNNSGPFRWWIYESFRDNKPMDVFLTELLEMKGSTYNGGTSGFALATQNDVPMAAKATILANAFLGVETKCARCHDAPYHNVSQKQLFQLASMLSGAPLEIPPSSSVPMDKLHEGDRKPLITVSLKPGTNVAPAWPFSEFIQARKGASLAELITAPENERFAKVMVNRMWKRYLGRGLIESAHDWEGKQASHPELLRWLAHRFVESGYDYKALARLILTSETYQRTVTESPAAQALFAGPTPRRMEAEQVVDTLFSTVGLRMDTEEITMDQDLTNRRNNFVNLGKPRRSWMFNSLSNERDRPSLGLPRAQAVIDVLTAFGWRPSRQEPLTDRNTDTNVLQPAIIANGTMGTWITRLSDKHALTHLCLEEQPLETLVERIFLRMYTRHPNDHEKHIYGQLLAPGYDQRAKINAGHHIPPHEKPQYLSWSNHLRPKANELALVKEQEAMDAFPSTQRLAADWRNRAEDMIWALVNRPEMIYIP